MGLLQWTATTIAVLQLLNSLNVNTGIAKGSFTLVAGHCDCCSGLQQYREYEKFLSLCRSATVCHRCYQIRSLVWMNLMKNNYNTCTKGIWQCPESPRKSRSKSSLWQLPSLNKIVFKFMRNCFEWISKCSRGRLRRHQIWRFVIVDWFDKAVILVNDPVLQALLLLNDRFNKQWYL